jgi:hypothetical protein
MKNNLNATHFNLLHLKRISRKKYYCRCERLRLQLGFEKKPGIKRNQAEAVSLGQAKDDWINLC